MSNLDIIDSESSAEYVFETYKIMRDNKIIMMYEGEFTQEITKTVLNMAERNFDYENIDSGIKKKVFNVMVEALQNICKHQYSAIDSTTKNLSAIFLIGYDKDNYYVTTGNYIINEKIDLVKNRIEQVNSLDQEGLKQLFKDARLNTTISEVGGAGLGFIDMARKSNNKLIYSFKEQNDKTSFFTLLSKISTKKEEN
jgi:coenzyme F420-reducing hydrogenase delta subunit